MSKNIRAQEGPGRAKRLALFAAVSVLVGGAVVLLAGSIFPSRAEDAGIPNIVEQLQHRIGNGTAKLNYDEGGHGYLPALLQAFHIPRDSQLLVFSGSSLQFDRINQKSPRALYYQDNIAVGSVQNGRLIEILTTDSNGGVAYYTLDVAKKDKPHFERQTGECTICHAYSSRWAPGMMVADSDTGANGLLLNVDPRHPFRLTDDRTPFENRYGGWYLTGITGEMKHRGNVTLDPADPGTLPPGGLNLTTLADRVGTSRYLDSGSDVVSLLTLEHQAGFVNLVAQINAQYRNLDRTDVKPELRATATDIDESIGQLVAYMTFADEIPLPSPVTGSSTFSKTFAGLGPEDAKGRSLRQFDLKTRIFHYPLSYMIYSQAFNNLNPLARERVLRGLYDVLRGADKSPVFAKLEVRDGAAAINIVAATKAGLPDYWKPLPEEAQKN